MQAQHTPGPWTIESHAGRTFVGLRGGRGDAGADIPVAEVINGIPGESGPNARLIAAAPQNLSANRYAVEKLSDLPRFLRANGHCALASIVADVLDTQRAAIAKAQPASLTTS